MSDKFLYSKVEDPNSFGTDIWETIEFPTPEVAKEMAKRWNSFDQLKKRSEELKAENAALRMAAKNAAELAWFAIKNAGYRMEIHNETLRDGIPENAEIIREDSTEFDGVVFKARPWPDNFY